MKRRLSRPSVLSRQPVRLRDLLGGGQQCPELLQVDAVPAGTTYRFERLPSQQYDEPAQQSTGGDGRPGAEGAACATTMPSPATAR